MPHSLDIAVGNTALKRDMDIFDQNVPVNGALKGQYGPLNAADNIYGHQWYDDIADSEHVRAFKLVDWSSTLLGPLHQWSHALRLYTHQLHADSRPAVIYWSSHKVAIYNEAFIPLAGKTHPTLMGARFEDAFAEIWDDIKPVFDGAVAGKKAVDVVEMQLMVERSGYTEETYFTGNFNPLRGDNGKVEGFYNALGEVTRQKLNDRRNAMLNLVSTPPHLYTTETIGTHIIESLGTNSLDVPFALLYQVDDNSSAGECLLHLRGSLGVPKSHKLALKTFLLSSDQHLAAMLRKAQDDVVTLTRGPEFDGIEWAGYEEPSKNISAISLCNAGRLLGFLVVGSNPRRPIDADHEQFVRDMSRQISSTIALNVSTEEANKRQQRLISQLADSEKQIRYMAEHLDIGMEHLALDGTVIWANERYFSLMDRSRPAIERRHLPFQAEVHDDDQPLILASWNRTVQGEKLPPLELRMKRLFVPPSGPPVHATVLLSAFPYIEGGKIKSIMTCMTDVSRLKWAESWQARAAIEAQEAKRLQAEFTDAISHEVRNPLSAIFQLADSIAGSLKEARAGSLELHDCLHMLEDNAEAANTILLCAKHQKRIVDDVLTLSKMDFMLMSLTPTAVQPHDLADGALKMLEAELTAANIELHTVAQTSLNRLNVTSVLCDSLRVTQILINLLSNAIKFTRREEHRRITLTYGASLSDPRRTLPQNITWAASKQEHQDVISGEEWGSGEPIYLTFLITDTGAGMDEEELARMFNRFEQASPKTSIKYGGSGLGLFISQSLSEKQNGAIGVASEPGKGSTFAFYVKARRTSTITPPTNAGAQRVEQVVDHLPTAQAQLAALTLLDRPLLNSAHSSKSAYHILLVEDNLVNQRILLKQLNKAGCVVYVANHGLEALDILKKTSLWKSMGRKGHHLDIVLMDWEMPVMDGLTCSRQIRALERAGDITDHIEIIAVTANVRQEQVERAMDAGVDDVMPKPFVVADLLKTIKYRLGR